MKIGAIRKWFKNSDNSFAQFLKNFLILFFFRSIGILVCLITNILNGRTLSIADNGQFNLVFNIGNLLIIPLVMGINPGLLKIVPETPKEKRDDLISTVMSCNIFVCIVTMIISLLAMPLFCKILHITKYSWILAIMFALTSNWCIMVDTILRTRESFTIIGIAKVVSSVAILAAYLFTIFYLKIENFYIYLLINIGGQVIIFLITLFRIGKVRIRFNKEIAKTVYKICTVYMLSWLLSTLIFRADMYALAYYASKEDVGIYSVYMDSIRNYFSIFYHDIFAAVFLPIILNRNISRENMREKIIKWLPLSFLILMCGTAGVVVMFLLAYGNKYPLIPSYILYTSLGIAFQGIYFFLDSLLVTDGMKGAILSLKILAEPLIFIVAGVVIFTSVWGIEGTFISFVISQFILMVLAIIRVLRKKKA